MWTEGLLALAGVLLLSSAFFSASEAAFYSLGRIELRRMERDGRASSLRVRRALSKPGDLLVTILTGNTLVNVATSVIATVLFVHWLGPGAVGLSILSVTATVLLVGEVTPKTVAVNFPEGIARALAGPILWVRFLLAPLSRIVSVLSNACLRKLKIDAVAVGSDRLLSRGELNLLLEGADDAGIMTEQESQLVQNILEFSETRAAEVMTPRVDVVAAPEDIDRAELERLVVSSKHSRIPIYRRTIDEIVGFLPTRDFLLMPEKSPKDLMRPVVVYPDRALVSRIFYETQRARVSLVVVVNEYGEMVGLLTREDLLEELVGEIYDEFETRDEPLKPLAPGLWSATGQLNVEELNEALQIELPVADAYTLNGFLTGLHGGIPRKGETLRWQGAEFTIAEVSRHRVQRCLIRLPERAEG